MLSQFEAEKPLSELESIFGKEKTQNYALVIARLSCYSAAYSDYILHNYS